MKHPQHIAAVDLFKFTSRHPLRSGFNEMSLEDFFHAAERSLVLEQREALDNDTTTQHDVQAHISNLATLHGIVIEFLEVPQFEYKGDRTRLQLLPYYVLRFWDGSDYRYFMYQRGKGVGEARLAGNDSIGYGGHVDLADMIATNSIIDLRETLRVSAERELAEELIVLNPEGEAVNIGDVVHPQFRGLIYDKSNNVGMVHLGLVFVADLPVGFSVIPNEVELIPRLPMTASEILENDNAESWTKIVANSV